MHRQPLPIRSPAIPALTLLLALTQPAQASTPPPTPIDAAACLPAPGTRDMWNELPDGTVCRVVLFRQVSHTGLWFQLQAYLTDGQTPQAERIDGRIELGGPQNAGAGIVVLAAASRGKPLTPLAGWKGEGAVIDEPRLVRTIAGPLIVIPMSADVSSHPTEDAVFRWRAGNWRAVDTTSWLARVPAPHGLIQRNGNAMNWPRLRAFGAWWRDADPECCPTGGTYVAQLAVTGDRLRLASVRSSKHDLPFP